MTPPPSPNHTGADAPTHRNDEPDFLDQPASLLALPENIRTSIRYLLIIFATVDGLTPTFLAINLLDLLVSIFSIISNLFFSVNFIFVQVNQKIIFLIYLIFINLRIKRTLNKKIIKKIIIDIIDRQKILIRIFYYE